jgi:hypothetical protein
MTEHLAQCCRSFATTTLGALPRDSMMTRCAAAALSRRAGVERSGTLELSFAVPLPLAGMLMAGIIYLVISAVAERGLFDVKLYCYGVALFIRDKAEENDLVAAAVLFTLLLGYPVFWIIVCVACHFAFGMNW